MGHLTVHELLVALLSPVVGDGNLLDVVDELLLVDRDSTRRVLIDPQSGLFKFTFFPGCPSKCFLQLRFDLQPTFAVVTRDQEVVHVRTHNSEDFIFFTEYPYAWI